MSAPSPDPKSIYQIAQEYHQQLLNGDAAASEKLIRAYASAYKAIEVRLAPILADIQKLQAQGDLSPNDVVKLAGLERAGVRLALLAGEIEAEIGTFGQAAEQIITQAQLAAVQTGIQGTLSLIGAQLPPGGIGVSLASVPFAAVQQLVGHLSSGSPLNDLFATFGPQAAQAAEKALLDGILSGQSSRRVAREIKAALGTSFTRAETISRTELFRSYREAARKTMQAQPDNLVQGWIWNSARNRRTCAACWAMHGTFHTLDEKLNGHPRCRCTMIPATRTWAELGYDVSKPGAPREPKLNGALGSDLFSKLPAEQQLAILGPSKYAALANGQIALSDLVGSRHSARWGSMRYEASLERALEVAAGKKPGGYVHRPKPKLAPKILTPPKPAAPPPKPKPDPAYKAVSSQVTSLKKKHDLGTLAGATAFAAAVKGVQAKARASGSPQAIALAHKHYAAAKATVDALTPSASQQQAAYKKASADVHQLKQKVKKQLQMSPPAASGSIAQAYLAAVTKLHATALAAGNTKAAAVLAKHVQAAQKAVTLGTLAALLKMPPGSVPAPKAATPAAPTSAAAAQAHYAKLLDDVHALAGLNAHQAKHWLVERLEAAIAAAKAGQHATAASALSALLQQVKSAPSKSMFSPGGVAHVPGKTPPPVVAPPAPSYTPPSPSYGSSSASQPASGTSSSGGAYMSAEVGHQWATSSFAAWRKSLSPGELQALKTWTGGAYTAWGRWMRGKSDALDAQTIEQIKLAAQALRRGVLKESIVVYRAVKGTTGRISTAELLDRVGGTLDDMAFTATTVNRPVWGGNSQYEYKMEITVPSGTPAGYLENFSVNKGEYELLLPPGAVFRVDEVLLNHDGYARYVRVTLIGFEEPGNTPRGI